MEKLRIVVRQIIPNIVRRPLANMVYRIIACIKSYLHRFRRWAGSTPAQEIWENRNDKPKPPPKINNKLLTVYPVRAVKRLYILLHNTAAKLKITGYLFLRTRLGNLWHAAAFHRHLIGKKPDNLNYSQRIRRFALTIFFALPDWRYRRVYAQFENSIIGLSEREERVTSNGLVMMIGTLGPGGSERQAVLTLTGLLELNYKPLELICVFLRSEAQRFYLAKLLSAGVPVNELDRGPSDDSSHNIENIIQSCQILPQSLIEVTDYVRSLYKRNPSIVHLWLDEINIKGGLAAVALGIPRIILGMRSLPPVHFQLHQPYMREGYRWLARQNNVTMTNNSIAGARAYEKWLGLPDGHIHVVHNGFAFDTTALEDSQANRDTYRRKHNIPAEAFTIGTVIRLSEEKRPLLWLDIAAKVRHQVPRIHFLVVGDGPMRNELESRAANDDLIASVHFTGYEKNASDAIAAMDLFLLTSRTEGLPNVLVESQALGVPVITTDVGGAKETMKNGETGLFLENDDAQQAANVIINTINDKEWLKIARDSAPDFVKKEFSLSRMLDNTLAIYGDSAFSNNNIGVHCETSS